MSAGPALVATLALATAAAAPPAEGTPGFCLVERVVARGGGLSIAFAGDYPASAVRASGGPPRPTRIGPGRPPSRLRPGETLRIGFPHGVCALTVAVNAGRPGLLARNWSQDDGESMMFFPAERRR